MHMATITLKTKFKFDYGCLATVLYGSMLNNEVFLCSKVHYQFNKNLH